MAQLHRAQIAGTSWNPGQYLKFADHRLRPALELLDRVPLENPSLVYDLGSGSGNVTRLIAERWPAARVIGVDNSPEMLSQAAATPSSVEWVEADIRTWQPAERPDVIYTNATLQWVEGHHDLFPRLARFLRPGGCLAVQVPMSWPLPSHVLMRKTLADGGPGGTPLATPEFRQAMVRDWVEPAEVYYDLLAAMTTSLDLWETEYLQLLEGQDPVLEWVKGTGLRPILAGLNEGERETFLAEYTRRLREAYPMRADGKTIYRFRRLFLVATV